MLVLHVIAFLALAIVLILLLLVLFEPALHYKLNPPTEPLDSEEFLRVLGALADAQLYRDSNVEVLSDGKKFYEAELAIIAQATRSIHIEAFIFHKSAIGDRFLSALIDRAKNGVQVRVIVDSIGSFPTPDRYFAALREAGGHVCWYQPIRWSTLKRFNNRTHRELIIVDANIGFIGGAGIASHWDTGEKGKPPWRDIMFRIKGPLVAGLQTTFAENWLESSTEILASSEYYQAGNEPGQGSTAGIVIISSPTAGRSTRNHVLFQTLIASALHTIDIHSPYFLPDQSIADEFIRAAQQRGVKVRVVVPGASNNHGLTRLASRRRYGPLVKAGIEIYEYQPGMIHTKAMTVDGQWSVVGSTNFDSRSFDLNDEVNLAALDNQLASTLQQEFTADLSSCRQITYEQWKHRSLIERAAAATVGRLLERQE